MSFEQVDAIINNYQYDESMLIGIMQDIQRENNYLPKEDLLYLSEKLKIPMTKIYGIASFYNAFSLVPRGKHKVKVCTGTACHVRGAERILDVLETELGVKNGESTSDLRFHLETVRCIGCCSLAPAVTVDEDTHGNLSSSATRKLIKKYK